MTRVRTAADPTTMVSGGERAAVLELADTLAERLFELGKTAADEQPLVCVGPAGHGRGERITRPGRDRRERPVR